MWQNGKNTIPGAVLGVVWAVLSPVFSALPVEEGYSTILSSPSPTVKQT